MPSGQCFGGHGSIRRMWARTPEQVLFLRRTREVIILYALFVAPGLASPVMPDTFTMSVSPLIALTLRNVAFALLVLYLLDIQDETTLLGASIRELRPGLVALVWLLLFGASLLVSAAASAVGVDARGLAGAFTGAENSVLRSPLGIATLGGAMLSVGLVEELLFRAYLIARLMQLRVRPLPAAGAAALLFAVGHSYQGLPAVLFAFVAGLGLGLLWLRRPALTSFAVGHAAYNLSAVAIAAWYAG